MMRKLWKQSHDVLCHSWRGGRWMTSRIWLEPEAQAFAEASAKLPFLFTLGPERGRLALDEVQVGQVSKLPVDVEDLIIDDGPSGQVAVCIVRPPHAPE